MARTTDSDSVNIGSNPVRAAKFMEPQLKRSGIWLAVIVIIETVILMWMLKNY